MAVLPRPLPRVEISPGELLDKITILQIKQARIIDRAKLINVSAELALLQQAWADTLVEPAGLTPLVAELKAVNERLWDVEDALRECEEDAAFGSHFIELARSVYRLNDQRASLKRRINELCGSPLIEEKSYRCSPNAGSPPNRPAPTSLPAKAPTTSNEEHEPRVPMTSAVE